MSLNGRTFFSPKLKVHFYFLYTSCILLKSTSGFGGKKCGFLFCGLSGGFWHGQPGKWHRAPSSRGRHKEQEILRKITRKMAAIAGYIPHVQYSNSHVISNVSLRILHQSPTSSILNNTKENARHDEPVHFHLRIKLKVIL